ncbi:MAG: ATP-dependent helicase, partial [Variovorax sp.]
MTDAFEAQGDFAPVQSTSDEFVAVTESHSDATLLDTLDVAAAPADVPKAPNGFVRLGLAPELV